MPDDPLAARPATRRAVLGGLAALPLGVLSSPILAGPLLKNVAFATAGGHAVTGALGEPGSGRAPAVILVHDLGGLTSSGRGLAGRLADEGFLAFAIDLFGFAVDPDADQASLIQRVDPAVAMEKLKAAEAWLAAHERGNGRVGVVGWGYGGGWATSLAVAAPVGATVVYYGDVGPAAAAAGSLSGPVLGHFASRDPIMNRDLVGGLETAMAAAGKADQLTVWWYEAERGFADPDGPRFDAAGADLAWQRTVDFLKASLA